MNHMIICWKCNLCVVCIFKKESNEEKITNESMLARHVLAVFPVQVTSWLWSGGKWFKIWHILPRNFKINLCSLGKSKHHEKKQLYWNNELYSAVKNILFWSRLTLPTHRHLREANVCKFILKSLFAVNLKITFDLSFAYLKIISSLNESLTPKNAVIYNCAT